MYIALRTILLLAIGLTLIGYSKDGRWRGSSQPIAKVDPNLPAVTLRIPGMF
jgi:hypothetical protein